jgi:hypothetical protein
MFTHAASPVRALIHTIAVLTATALMFTPAANAYFKAFKGRQSNGFSSTTHSASG